MTRFPSIVQTKKLRRKTYIGTSSARDLSWLRRLRNLPPTVLVSGRAFLHRSFYGFHSTSTSTSNTLTSSNPTQSQFHTSPPHSNHSTHLIHSTAMPRSRGGRSAPARRPSASPAPAPRPAGNQQQSRGMTTTAQRPPSSQAQAGAQQQQGKSPGLFGQMASTAA